MTSKGCDFKATLEKIAREKAPGPSTRFSVPHLIVAIEAISEEKCGRIRLSEHLRIGEGTTRTIIRRLKAEGIISVSKEGCSLTKEGKFLWQTYHSTFSKIVSIGTNELTDSTHNSAILIRRPEVRIGSGILQRDAAVKTGAKSATTMVFKSGKLKIPAVSDDISTDFPEIARKLIEFLHPEENDVIILGTAENQREAEYGTLAAALTLFD